MDQYYEKGTSVVTHSSKSGKIQKDGNMVCVEDILKHLGESDSFGLSTLSNTGTNIYMKMKLIVMVLSWRKTEFSLGEMQELGNYSTLKLV